MNRSGKATRSSVTFRQARTATHWEVASALVTSTLPTAVIRKSESLRVVLKLRLPVCASLPRLRSSQRMTRTTNVSGERRQVACLEIQINERLVSNIATTSESVTEMKQCDEDLRTGIERPRISWCP